MQQQQTINHRHTEASLEHREGFLFSSQAIPTAFPDTDFCFPEFYTYQFCPCCNHSVLPSADPIPCDPVTSDPIFTDPSCPCEKLNSLKFDCSGEQGNTNGSFDPTSGLTVSDNVCTAYGRFVLSPVINEASIHVPLGRPCAESKIHPNNRHTRLFTTTTVNLIRRECGMVCVWGTSHKKGILPEIIA